MDTNLPDSAGLSNVIREQAAKLGLTAVGFARAEELVAEAAHLREWLGAGFQAGMDWMTRNPETRTDVRKAFPGARSVIVVALNYYTEHPHEDDPATGKISRYAWGEDYHDVLSGKLESLLGFIRDLDPSITGKVYVDTGPVMEKAWAHRAGVGWIGKHTNVITRQVGSWVFLGVILIDKILTYDPPATDHCGSCTLCIEACPTQAIVAPYLLDGNRCISYLTIEHRGEFDMKEEYDFDRWVYGCDICQDVCPWNIKFSESSGMTEFEPKEGNIAPELIRLAGMTVEEFREQFRGSPVKRTKLAGLKRNALHVLSSPHSQH